ncbi:TonB-dependent receptor [Compostibacter hankyongensis]|uniref:TonB-dependent receptor n=1 Tax=Compostibacter hankyongensis TaxID=1007089 RepID=A0ABP8FUF1_9BACT
MKLVIILMAATCMQVSARSNAQNISLSGRHVSLEKIFREIRKQTGYDFFYKNELLRLAHPVNVNVRDISLKEALDACFKDQPLSYSLVGKTIVVKERPKQPAPPSKIPEAIIKKADIEVTGLVTDSSGAPMPGVTVYLKSNKSVGTATDPNGRYILEVPDNATLVFSMIGFESQEVPVAGKKTINIRLLPASTQLGETVVTAFETHQNKADMVGSVTSISADDLAKNPSSNLTTSLAGRAAGLIAFQRSGEPGQDNANFFIRGVTTFGYKTDPLILIDGVELTATDLARIQPDDIASFSILKDATATAVYGARGANGVILVTTKQGAVGKAKLSFRLENSISAPTRNVQIADPVTYMKMYNEAIVTRDPFGVPLYSEDKIANTEAGTNPIAYPANDWQKLLFKDYTTTRRINLNVSGGGGVARYFVSGSYDRDNGLMNVDHRNNFNNNIKLNSYTLRTNVNITLTKTTELSARLSGNFDDYTGPISGGAAMYNEIMHSNPVLFPPYYPTDSAHQYVKHIMFGNYTARSGSGVGYSNPYADMVKGYKNYSRSLMQAQLELKQDFSFLTEGLSTRIMGYTYRQSYFDVVRAYSPFYYQLDSYDKLTDTYAISNLNEEGGTEYLGYNQSRPDVSSSFYMEAMVDYNRTFKENHGISGMVIYQMRSNQSSAQGDLQQSLPFRNLGTSGRLTYNYDKRYYAEFDFGYNGSERFAANHRYGFFPSYGLAWTVSNEKFFKSIKPVISNLRLRGTYGIIGNDAIGSPQDRFFYISNVNMNDGDKGATFGGTSSTESTYSLNGITVSRYANQDITWETSTEKNIAIDIGLFDDLSITAEFYSQYRDHILMTRSIPLSMGLSAASRANVGEASGKGTDISLEYNKYFSNGFWLQAMGNFTYATSKYRVFEEPHYDEPYRYHVGHSLSQTYGYIAERLFVDEKDVENSPRQNFGEYGAGDVKYLDVNRDGEITEADMVPIGYPTTPEIVYGFGFSAGYKGFDISAFFQGLSNEAFWINVKPYDPATNTGSTIPFASDGEVLQAYADSYWSEDHRDVNALWPRLSPAGSSNNFQPSTWFMRNGAFLRLKQLEIGYSLPKSIQKKLHMSRLRIYANASNLFTISKFKMWDVEMGGNGMGYPIQRVFNLGLNLDIN